MKRIRETQLKQKSIEKDEKDELTSSIFKAFSDNAVETGESKKFDNPMIARLKLLIVSWFLFYFILFYLFLNILIFIFFLRSLVSLSCM